MDGGQKIKSSWREKPKPGELFFPDALADETVYRVVGRATNEAERMASENLRTERFSDTRQVLVRLFRWPQEVRCGLLAVLQYNFSGANPGGACPSIGLLVHLVRNAVNWEVRNQYLLETSHHSSLQRIELLDLTGDGADELVIESNFGGAGTVGSSLQVFDLSRGSFDELLHTNSRLEYMDQEGYTQVLDVDRTLQSHGQQFCVLKTMLFERGKWFDAPRITRPCYKRGDGVDSRAVRNLKRKLAPVH